MSILTSPAGLTPEHLTVVLRSSGVLRDAAVTSARVDVVPAGTGFAAQSAYVSLEYDRAESGAPPAISRMPVPAPLPLTPTSLRCLSSSLSFSESSCSR